MGGSASPRLTSEALVPTSYAAHLSGARTRTPGQVLAVKGAVWNHVRLPARVV